MDVWKLPKRHGWIFVLRMRAGKVHCSALMQDGSHSAGRAHFTFSYLLMNDLVLLWPQADMRQYRNYESSPYGRIYDQRALALVLPGIVYIRCAAHEFKRHGSLTGTSLLSQLVVMHLIHPGTGCIFPLNLKITLLIRSRWVTYIIFFDPCTYFKSTFYADAFFKLLSAGCHGSKSNERAIAWKWVL